MELLEKCRTLFDTLQTVNKDLLYVEDKLKESDLSPDEYEMLYRKEFELAMDISSIYEDLNEKLNILEKEHGYEFLARRMRRNINEIVVSEVIDVD